MILSSQKPARQTRRFRVYTRQPRKRLLMDGLRDLTSPEAVSRDMCAKFLIHFFRFRCRRITCPGDTLAYPTGQIHLGISVRPDRKSCPSLGKCFRPSPFVAYINQSIPSSTGVCLLNNVSCPPCRL